MTRTLEVLRTKLLSALKQMFASTAVVTGICSRWTCFCVSIHRSAVPSKGHARAYFIGCCTAHHEFALFQP